MSDRITLLATAIEDVRTELRADLAADRNELAAEITAVRALIASEAARRDTRIDRLEATVKAQPSAIMLRLGALMLVLTGIVLVAQRYLLPHG